jgi:hypothetical protein
LFYASFDSIDEQVIQKGLEPNMSFAEISKKKKKDEWVVVQGVPMRNGYTVRDIVYHGPGGVAVVRAVNECRSRFKTLGEWPVIGVDQVYKAFGYSKGASMTRYAHRMSLWEDEVAGYYGWMTVGPSDSRISVKIMIYDLSNILPVEYGEKQDWKWLSRCFTYAEMYDLL